MKNPRDIIKRPVITERTSDYMVNNAMCLKWIFVRTKPKSNKQLKQIFNVKVTRLTRCALPGKPKRYGRYSGYRSEWKKAIVQLSA